MKSSVRKTETPLNQELIRFLSDADLKGETGIFQHNSEWIFQSEESITPTSTTKTYYFGYSKVLTAGNSTPTLFDRIQLCNIFEPDLTAGLTLDIEINGYRIQSELAEADITGDSFDKEQLTKIFNIYLTQNGGNTI